MFCKRKKKIDIDKHLKHTRKVHYIIILNLLQIYLLLLLHICYAMNQLRFGRSTDTSSWASSTTLFTFFHTSQLFTQLEFSYKLGKFHRLLQVLTLDQLFKRLKFFCTKPLWYFCMSLCLPFPKRLLLHWNITKINPVFGKGRKLTTLTITCTKFFFTLIFV